MCTCAMYSRPTTDTHGSVNLLRGVWGVVPAAQALAPLGFQQRLGIQFHWDNRAHAQPGFGSDSGAEAREPTTTSSSHDAAPPAAAAAAAAAAATADGGSEGAAAAANGSSHEEADAAAAAGSSRSGGGSEGEGATGAAGGAAGLGPYASFDGFLADLKQQRRKSIRQERRSVERQGLRVRRLAGRHVTPELWDRFHSFYVSTVDK